MYDEGIINIESGSYKQMLDTLKHELVHVWLYENGHKNQDGKEVFSYEDVCEIAALSNNFINRILAIFLENITWKLIFSRFFM